MIKKSVEKKLNKYLAKYAACEACDHNRDTCGVPVHRCAGPHRHMTDEEMKRRLEKIE